ncbi:PREDICTED: EPIDERMAL PATTERNING FACTOR-like protein 2 [Tarenaya hassleriana]|uniref:EPIDERMAL PATTERNING FACTOR-like protein 2 n=1 Tax=Tarenaya hassleriana TaxID=28532 RepID=UPI00053C3486|nr:PREDICTED: EPIDERMAL PATTERNING FACTOR-like protein 2 [Tarenaya hassleriana]
MGLSQNCVINLFMMLLLLSGFTHRGFMAQGRAVPKFLEDNAQVEEEIGSMPPKCEKRCETCRECEAVQVPVTFQDDFSNYKPLSWKCKCDNSLFNP